MGASLSEPCTMVDLNHDVWRCATSPNKLRRVGWSIRGHNLRFDQLVAGCLHVDDLVVFSRIWCIKCLAERVKRMFPDDVGFDVEEEGPVLRVLGSIVHTDLQLDIN